MRTTSTSNQFNRFKSYVVPFFSDFKFLTTFKLNYHIAHIFLLFLLSFSRAEFFSVPIFLWSFERLIIITVSIIKTLETEIYNTNFSDLPQYLDKPLYLYLLLSFLSRSACWSFLNNTNARHILLGLYVFIVLVSFYEISFVILIFQCFYCDCL